jgi:hypothetical protein
MNRLITTDMEHFSATASVTFQELLDENEKKHIITLRIFMYKLGKGRSRTA